MTLREKIDNGMYCHVMLSEDECQCENCPYKDIEGSIDLMDAKEGETRLNCARKLFEDFEEYLRITK